MSSKLFSGQTPALTDLSDGAPGLDLGTTFYTDAACSCIGLEWRFPDTDPGTITGYLYDHDGTLLASGTFSSPVAGQYNTLTFGSPVALSVNHSYVVAIHTAARYVATANFFDAALTNGHLTAPESGTDPIGEGTLRNGVLNVGATPAFPANGSGNHACYFVGPIVTFGQSANLGTTTETDSAISLTKAKTKALGQTTETDSAIALSRTKIRTVGLSAETDSAFALTRTKYRLLGTALETDSAIALTVTSTATVRGSSAAAVTAGRASVPAVSQGRTSTPTVGG